MGIKSLYSKISFNAVEVETCEASVTADDVDTTQEYVVKEIGDSAEVQAVSVR